MALVDPPISKNKNSITLFGQKKKSQAQKIVDELSSKNIPAKIIRLDNGTEKVINLVSGKAVYNGKIETEDNSVGSQVSELLNNRRYPVSISDSGDPTYYDSNNPANEYMDVSPAVTDTFDGQGVTYTGPGGSYTFSETPTTDVYSEGFFPESDNVPSDSVVTSKQLFGDDSNYVPNTNYPRRDNEVVTNELDDDRNFLQKSGDNIMKIFTGLKTPVQVRLDPVTGENVARSVPMAGAILDSALVMTPFSGLGAAMGTVSDRLLARQESDARYAVEGFSGFAAIQAIDLGTGNPVTITASPGLGGTVSTNQNIVGPLAYNGSVFENATAIAAEAIKFETPTVTSYADRLYRTSPRAEEGQKEIGRPKVQVNPLLNRGEYNDETGEVNLGAGRFGQTTGAFLSDDGTYQFTSGRASLVTDSTGNPVTTNNGIVYSGLRGNIVSSDTVPDSVNLLSGMEDGSIKTNDYTLNALAGTQDYIDQTTGFNYNYPTIEDYSSSSPTALIETEFYNNDPVENVSESGVTYSGPYGSATFSETLDSDVYSEGTTPDFYDPPEEVTDYNPPPTSVQPNYSNNNNDSDDNNGNFDSGDNAGFSEDDYSDAYSDSFADGGTVGMQEGGVAPQQQGVSQIVQGAGFIAPQQNANPEMTIADDIPLEAEEGDFIINAPAAEFAGRQDIVSMITEAINSLREKGVDIQYGNPKIPVEKSVKLAVSRNEVYVPRPVAEEIGYDKLQKINKRGQKEVQRRQEEAQGQAARGGFVKKASGDVVTKDETLKEDKSSMMGTDEGSFIQNLGRAVYDNIKKDLSGFISPKEKEKKELKTLEESKVKPLETEKVEGFPEPPPSRPEQQYYGVNYSTLIQALERVETGDVSKNVQIRDKFKENPYRFTEVTIRGPEGSSAFGLRQLTYTAMQDLLDNNVKNLSREEIKYATKFIDTGKQRVNLENSNGQFVYEGPENNRVKISSINKAKKLGISLNEFKTRLGTNGSGLIPEAQHKKYYNKFADMFFKSKLSNSKSLEEGIGNYYSKTNSPKRNDYVNKFKDALKQIDAGVILNKIEPNSKKYTPIPKRKPEQKQKNSFLSPTMG